MTYGSIYAIILIVKINHIYQEDQTSSMTSKINALFSAFVEEFEQLYLTEDFMEAEIQSTCDLFFLRHRLLFRYFAIKIPTIQLRHRQSEYFNTTTQRTFFPAQAVYSVIKRRLQHTH